MSTKCVPPLIYLVLGPVCRISLRRLAFLVILVSHTALQDRLNEMIKLEGRILTKWWWSWSLREFRRPAERASSSGCWLWRRTRTQMATSPPTTPETCALHDSTTRTAQCTSGRTRKHTSMFVMPASDYFTTSVWLSFSLRHASAGMKTRKTQRYLSSHERCQPAQKGARRLRRLVHCMHNRRLALALAPRFALLCAVTAGCSGPSPCAGSPSRSTSTPSPSSATPSSS